MSKVIGVIDNEDITNTDREIEIQIASNLNYIVEFTKQIYKEIDPSCFQIPEVSDTIKWILEFYRNNKYVPEGHIHDLINSKKLQFRRFNELHEIVIEAIEDPRNKSRENVDYLIQMTREHMLSQQLKKIFDKAKSHLKIKQPYKAIEIIKEELRKTAQDSEDVIRTKPFDKETFDQVRDSLFDDKSVLLKMPGEIGNFFGPLGKGDFISFLGPEKVGKTGTLIGMTKQLLLNRCKVTYISIGDASKDQLLKRIYACCFSRAYNRKYFNKTVHHPVKDCLLNQTLNCKHSKGKYIVTDGHQMFYEKYKTKHIPCTDCRKERIPSFWYKDLVAKPLSNYEQDSELFRKRLRVISNWEDNLRAYVVGQHQKTIEDLKDIVREETDRTGFVPHAIIIDYMDDIAFETGDGYREFRHKNAKLWGKTRAWSIQENCLILTATQSTRGSKNKENIEQGDESEDKRKAGYVTAMYSINQTFPEKKNQVIRYARLYAREEEAIPTENIVVLQNLSIAQPFVLSYPQPDLKDFIKKKPES